MVENPPWPLFFRPESNSSGFTKFFCQSWRYGVNRPWEEAASDPCSRARAALTGWVKALMNEIYLNRPDHAQ